MPKHPKHWNISPAVVFCRELFQNVLKIPIRQLFSILWRNSRKTQQFQLIHETFDLFRSNTKQAAGFEHKHMKATLQQTRAQYAL